MAGGRVGSGRGRLAGGLAGVVERAGASTTAGAASVSSNSRRAAASLASWSANAWESGAMTSKQATATRGRTAR